MAASRERKPVDSRVCARCGRTFEGRRKWADVWDQVRYCSDACRDSRREPVIVAAMQMIETLLEQRDTDTTICPSEAARALDPEGWRGLMPNVHAAARRLATSGRIEITQRGRRVEPDGLRGPVRLRRPRNGR